MKYLLVILLPIVSLPGHTALPPPPTWSVSASATFGAADPPGIATEVAVSVNETPSGDQVELTIRRTRRSCAAGVCRERDLLSGAASQTVGPGDAILDPRIRQGALHSTILVHDDVSNTELPVRVDVVWISSGPETCDRLYDALGCFRAATALGAVECGALMPSLRQTDTDGRLLHRPVQS